MATVESQIKVYIRAYLEGLAGVKEFSGILKEIQKTASRKTSSGLGQVGADAKKAGQQGLFAAGAMRVLHAAMSPLVGIGKLIAGVFATMVRQVQFAAAAFGLFLASSPALVFGLLVKEGLQFNDVMERQAIGLAALIQSTHDLFAKGQPNKPLEGVEAYKAATVIAEAATQRLRIKIIPLAATSEELLPIFNQIVTSGANAGLTLEQLEDTFVSLASAAQILQIPTARLGTEIRLLLAGTTRETSRLGPALFGSAIAAREFVKQHKASGDLFQALQVKVVAYNAALSASEQSYATLKENTIEVFQVLAGIATSGLFDRIKEGLSKITKSFFDLKGGKLKPEFETLFNLINDGLTRVGDFIVDLVDRAIKGLTEIAQWVQANQGYVSDILGDLLSIGTELGGIFVDLVSIVGEAEDARKKTADWHTILNFAAITIGLIRDSFNVLIGIIQAVGFTIIEGLLAPLLLVLDVLGLISQTAADAGNAVRGLRAGAHDFAESGAVKFAQGLDATNAKNATERFLNGSVRLNGNPTKTNTDNNFLAKLRRPAGAAGGGGRGRGDNGVSKLADAVRGLNDAKIDLVLTQFEQRINRVQFLMDAAKKALDRQLAEHFLSISGYYDKLLEVERTTIEAEIAQQQARREADIKRVDAKVKELETKRTAAKNPNEAKAFSVQIEIERTKLEAKLVEYKEKIAELTGKIKEAEIESAFQARQKTNALRDQTAEIQAQLLALQDRTADAELINIAGSFSDKLLTSLSNFDEQLGDPIKKTIDDIQALGRVTTTEFRNILTENGVTFDQLSVSTQALIALMTRLEQNAKFKGLQDGIQQVQDRLAQSIRETNQAAIDGGKTEDAAYSTIVQLIKEANVEILGLLDKAEKIALATGDKGFLLYIRQVKSELKETSQVSNQFAQDVNSILTGAFGGFVDSIIEGNDDILTSFRRMLSQMFIQMAKLIVQAILLKALFSALGLTGGTGSGGFGGFLSSLFGVPNTPGKHAEGTIVSGPGTSVSDSVPALLSHGEAVIPARQVARHFAVVRSLIDGTFASRLNPVRLASGGFVSARETAAAGAGGGGNTRIINALDPNLFEDYANSSSGERTILNLITRNEGKVKQALGLA